MEELNKLEDKGYIDSIWEQDSIYDDYKVIRLSDFGERELFKFRHDAEIKRFISQLESLRYDVSILDDYLLRQNLDRQIWEILNVEALDEFCNEFDRANLVPGVTKVCYEKLGSKEELLNVNKRKILENLLYVWDFSHAIYICHPNDVFKGFKPISEDVEEVKNINWDDIDVEMS